MMCGTTCIPRGVGWTQTGYGHPKADISSCHVRLKLPKFFAACFFNPTATPQSAFASTMGLLKELTDSDG